MVGLLMFGSVSVDDLARMFPLADEDVLRDVLALCQSTTGDRVLRAHLAACDCIAGDVFCTCEDKASRVPSELVLSLAAAYKAAVRP